MFKLLGRNPLRSHRIWPYRAMCLLLICILMLILILKKETKQQSSDAQIDDGKFIKVIAIELNNISRCYKSPDRKSIRYFADIMDNEHQPTSGKAIFFHETSCSKTGIAKLNSR